MAKNSDPGKQISEHQWLRWSEWSMSAAIYINLYKRETFMNNSVTQDSYIIYIQYYESCLGRLTMAARYGHLIGLWFENQKYELQYPGKLSDPIYERKDLPVFEQTALWLDLYFLVRIQSSDRIFC